ncbi:MAG TPA: hypothetical protein VLL08_17890 [Kineosporiaceae bacterium]|nr:hypothetical protein [Kineosporiaceae bacterium]
MQQTLVPEGFTIPPPLSTNEFRFEPLGSQHNDADHQAWTSSVDHIRRTPGFSGRGWPADFLTPDENRRDLERHANHFISRKGFTYAVIDRLNGEYLGCVYFYPARTEDYDVDVRSWVRADRAHLDEVIHGVVTEWLKNAWPWTKPEYAARNASVTVERRRTRPKSWIGPSIGAPEGFGRVLRRSP